MDYGRPIIAGSGVNADIDTSEEDVVIITDLNLLSKSQFTIFIDYVLGTHTSIQLRFYYLPQLGGTDWYQVPKKNIADGTIDDNPHIIDAYSPADSMVIEFPIGACYGFKMTADGVGGTNGSITAKVFIKNN